MQLPKGYPNLTVYAPRYKDYAVTISKRKLTQIKKFVTKLVQKKLEEYHYKVDSNNLEKRLITGLVGEAAVEKFLGIKIIDWTIGNSNKYNKPDIEKLGVGIKCVEYMLHPLVSISPTYPEIICVRMSERDVIICGIASVEVLKQYQDFNLVKAKGARMRKVKAGFFGFDQLDQFGSYQDLKAIIKSWNKEATK